MEMKLALLTCFMTFILSSTSEIPTVNWWCSQTPYPETCNHHLGRRHQNSSSSSSSLSKNQFLDMTVETAIDNAIVVLDQTKRIQAKSPNGPEKVLWTTCMEFCNGIIYRLNMTIDQRIEPTPLDIQTWLSAGLTYLQFCQKGFEMRNIRNSIFSSVSTNLTQLIRNSLAVSVLLRSSSASGFLSRTSQDQRQLPGFASPLPDVVVAQDGSGHFRTIQQAVDASRRRAHGRRFVIHVKAGIYMENVFIPNTIPNISIIGDGINRTIISSSRHMAMENAYDLKATATFQVWGDGFIAQDITFRNTAGPSAGQAVALLSGSHHSAFYHCSMEGYQDTLFTFSGEQFYRECQISGTVDFIFGDAAAVFQNCQILFRKPSTPSGGLVATAHARDNVNQSTGYSIQHCSLAAADDLKPMLGQYQKAYLGRPWFRYARAVFMQSVLDNLLDPQGWLKSEFFPGSENTVYFGEYRNNGPGSSTSRRVKWPGYHIMTDAKTAEYFTAAQFIEGYQWLPGTSIPWNPRL